MDWGRCYFNFQENRMNRIRAYKDIGIHNIGGVYCTGTGYVDVKDLIINRYQSRAYWYYRYPFFVRGMMKI